MKKLGIKIISVILCITMVASIVVNITLFADNRAVLSAEASALLTAWENLKMKDGTVLVQGQTPIAELPKDLGVTNTEKALLGSHFTKMDSDIADNWNSASKNVTARVNSQTVASLGFESVSFSVYSEVSQAELHFALSFEQGGDNNFPSGWNLVSKGFSTVDMSALMEGDKTITTATLKRDYSAQVGSVYVGSIIGYKTVDVEVPAEVYTMSDEELYEAAAALDLSLCSSGVEEFKNALLSLNKVLYPEASALIEAWERLEKDEYVTIAYPGGVKAGSPTKGETASLTGLTAEQKAKMGSHYWQMNSTSDIVWGITWENKDNLSQYDSVFYVVYGTAGAVCTKIDGGTEKYTGADSFREIAVTPSNAWWSLEHWSYDWYAPIYVGSVVGHKTVKATIPENVLAMSDKELYKAASKVDFSTYKTGAEDFKNALDALYAVINPEEAALISAWGNLKKFDNGYVIASPEQSVNVADSELATLVSDSESLEAFGGKYLKIVIPDGKTGVGILSYAPNGKYRKISGYDKVTFAAYAPNHSGNAKFAIYPYGNTAAPVAFQDAVAQGEVTIIDCTEFANGTANGKQIEYLEYVFRDSEAGGTLYMGALIGYKYVDTTVPTEVYSMTEEELYDYAVANVNTADYVAGVEEFNAALAALKIKAEEEAKRPPEEKALENLIEAWQAIALESKPKTDVIAVPRSEMGADNQSYSAEDVTDTTNIGVDNAKLGSKYMEKLSISTDGTPPGWNRQIWFAGFSANLTKYKNVYFYANAYKDDINTYAYLITQVNGEENYTYNSVVGWTKVSVDQTLTNAKNVKFIITDGEATHISYGSILGDYDYSPVLPENYESMSFEELVRAAAKIDCEGFQGTDDFKAALSEAKVLVDMSPDLAEKLIYEWKSMGNAKVDVVAVPASSYTGTDGQTYNRIEVTSSTTVTGLAKASVLGTYYYDKLPINSTDQKQEKYFSVIEANADISKYDTLSHYFAVFDENGNFINSTNMLQINAAEDKYAASSTGWGSFNHAFTQSGSQVVSNIKFWVFNAKNIAYVSFGSVLGHYIERPYTPKNIEELSFVDLVKEAEKCDVSAFESTAFKAALKECQDYIKLRRDELFAEYDALGLQKPTGAETMSVAELVDASLAVDLSSVQNTTKFGLAVWRLNLFTEVGAVIAEFKDIWQKVAELPANWYLMTPQQWITGGEALDLSQAAPDDVTAFNTSLEDVRDLLTKGKSNIDTLSKYVTDAKTMNWYDFTDESWKAFGEALEDASNVIDNYSEVTQKQVDAAEAELLDAWGKLKMYVRDQWFDAMDYFLKVEPELNMNKGSGPTTSMAVIEEKLPNGSPSVIALEEHTAGWYPWSFSGANLVSLASYDFFEIWYKANTENGSGVNGLGIQLMAGGGGKYYTYVVNISKKFNDGEWHRLEVPFTDFRDENGKSILDNPNFRAGIVWGINYGGEGSYYLSNFVVVKTQEVTAGVVPEVPKMAVIEREKIEPAPPPENPFTGVDRGDPWGDAEREENANPDHSTGDNAQQQVAAAEGEYGSNLTWKLMKDGTLVISGKGDMANIEDEAPWKEYIDRIVQVTVEDGVTSVGDKSFYGLTKLLKVNLPQTVTKIGNFAFYDCAELKFIVIPDKVETIGDYAFGYCYSEEEQIAIKVEKFGVYGTENSIAQAYSEAYELEFFAIAPDPNKTNVNNSEDNTSGTIGTVTDSNMNNTSDDAVQVATGECGKNLTWTYYSDGTLIISGTGDMTDFEEVAPWFAEGLNVKKAVIESGVTGIGDSAFYGCSNLSELVIADTVTRIGSFAFYECYMLKEVKLSAKITRVGPYAFGYVYDAQTQDAKLIEDFKLYVSDPSAALTYAKTYEVSYDVYEQTAENNKKSEPAKQGGLDWWIWTLIVVGGVVILGGIATVLVFIIKKKRNKAEVLK